MRGEGVSPSPLPYRSFLVHAGRAPDSERAERDAEQPEQEDDTDNCGNHRTDIRRKVRRNGRERGSQRGVSGSENVFHLLSDS